MNNQVKANLFDALAELSSEQEEAIQRLEAANGSLQDRVHELENGKAKADAAEGAYQAMKARNAEMAAELERMRAGRQADKATLFGFRGGMTPTLSERDMIAELESKEGALQHAVRLLKQARADFDTLQAHTRNVEREKAELERSEARAREESALFQRKHQEAVNEYAAQAREARRVPGLLKEIETLAVHRDERERLFQKIEGLARTRTSLESEVQSYKHAAEQAKATAQAEAAKELEQAKIAAKAEARKDVERSLEQGGKLVQEVVRLRGINASFRGTAEELAQVKNRNAEAVEILINSGLRNRYAVVCKAVDLLNGFI